MRRKKRPPPRHPLDIFDIDDKTGKVTMRPQQTQEEFDDWYNQQYGVFGGDQVTAWLFLLAVIVGGVAIFLVSWTGAYK